ncbi:hypothetical protein D3C87_200630 [compost metagenome]
MDCTFQTEDCKHSVNNFAPTAIGMRMILVLSLVVAFTSFTYSQAVEQLFRNGSYHAVYVSVGDLNGKRIVSDMQVTPKDSSNHEIHVELTILTDWKVSDSLKLDLVLDTVTKGSIETGHGKKEAIRYSSSKNPEVFVLFETPTMSTHDTPSKEKITVWSSYCASVHFPKRLVKYQKVLDVYHEK